MYLCDNCMHIWYMYSPIKLSHIMLTIQSPLEWYKYATLTSEVGAKGLQCECDASNVCFGHSHGGRRWRRRTKEPVGGASAGAAGSRTEPSHLLCLQEVEENVQQ